MKKIGLFLGAFLVAASCLFGQSQEIRFSISGGPDADKFEIVKENQLKLKKGVAADYEASDKLEVEVTADNGISKVSKLLSVEVADVSEVVSVKLDNATVKENASGAQVGNLTAVFAKEKRQTAAVDPSKVDQVSFAGHIRPIFQQSCVECHGPDKQKGDLRLDGPKTAIGESIIPGKPDKSELYKRITLPEDDSDFMPSEGEPLSQAQTELIRKWIKQGANWPQGGDTLFAQKIQPILRESCYECHGPKKQKGDFRFDVAESAMHVIQPGKPEKSEMVKRISLPPDHDDVMPAEGEPLSDKQIALIEDWIAKGANWPTTTDSKLVDYNKEVKPALAKLSESELKVLRKWIDQGAEWPKEEYYELIGKAFPVNLVKKPVANEEKIAMARLKRAGIPVRPVAQDVDWVRVNFSLVDDKITNEDLKPLAKMPHLTEVDLGETEITDKGLAHLKGLPNLMRLDLNNTAITDKGLAHLSELQNLTYLNLYGTQVSDAGLKHLTDLKSLSNLYVWQTEVTASGAKMLEGALPGVTVNRGVELAQVQKKQTSKGEKAKKGGKAKKGDGGSSTSIAQVLLGTFSE